MDSSSPPVLQVSHAERIRDANGPGERFSVWVQGCSRRCPGCFNPGLQTRRGGMVVSPEALADRAGRGGMLKGISLSGGEPFDQALGLGAFLETVARNSVSPPDVIVFTGYERVELEQDSPRFGPLLDRVDLLVDGPYEARRGPGGPLRGSANQALHALTVAGERLRVRVEAAGALGLQVVVSPSGDVIVTGFPPPDLIEGLQRKLGVER